MNIMVIGSGRWGSFLAWYLDKIGHTVTLYGRASSKQMSEIIKNRKNNYVSFSDKTLLTTSLEEIRNNDYIVISIPSQNLRGLMDELNTLDEALKNKVFILCMKGIDSTTHERLSEIVTKNVDKTNHVAVWLGPGHVQEFYHGVPNCMVIDSADEEVKQILVSQLSSDLIRFYYGNDLLGNEIGAAAKNVIGIAAGMLDGFNISTLKGALMARGTREIARLIKVMGGNEFSAYGLCHLGDYQATVFSEYSHNRGFGEAFVKNITYDGLAEGYYTVSSLVYFAKKYHVDLPICQAVYDILYNNKEPKETLGSLFSRSLKFEF